MKKMIKGKYPLADTFNIVLGKLSVLKSISEPVTFCKKELRFSELYYDIILYERYIRETMLKLTNWIEDIEIYKSVGYDHYAKPLTVDKDLLTNPVDVAKTTFVLTVSPYWADSRYNWGQIMGGFTFSRMKIKIEVYNENKKLVDYGTFTVSDIDSTGKVSITLNRNNLISVGNTYIYLKGYFCDYNGNVLCLIPTTGDGFIRKPIVVTQSLAITLGTTTANASGFTVYGELLGGSGSTSARCRLNITNNTSSDYVASSGRPYARYRWRAKDGSYTGQWSGNILMPSCTNIPKSFTRNDVVDAGNPPSYGNVTQWYVDYQVIMY